ncbi:MAG: 4-alpha-glucanotransferase, partial [Candidatus Poseidoniaceae archaeon]|nr:4-alpha-glucanotransferase [Candidatus Poseidoniaceae archaeon]
MESKHESGILCHVTSLPNQKLSDGYRFIDWLNQRGFAYWQLLPLTPPDEYRSPYASPSAFAGWDQLTESKQVHSMSEDEYWLRDWALFCAIKEDQGGKPWYEWPEPLKNREQQAMEHFQDKLE